MHNTFFYKKYKEYKYKAFKNREELKEKNLLPLRKKFYKQFINPNDLVFDIGANIGNRVRVFIEIEAKVVAIEPQPGCIKILQNKFKNKIVIEECGLSDKTEELEMQIANDSTISSFSKEFINVVGKQRFKNYSWNKTIKVPVTTLDNLIVKYGFPKFCKIDVEGFELKVLKGLSKPLPFLSFEYCIPEMLESTINCIDYLHELSKDGLYNYSIGESMNFALEEWVDYQQMIVLIKNEQFCETLFGDIYFKS